MSWKTLIDSMIRTPMFDDVVGRSHSEKLIQEVLEAGPAIYWYPGSGDDFAPLVLDMPENPTGRRLFPHPGNRQGKPLLLWMNDYLDFLVGFPGGGKKVESKLDCNRGKFQATVTIEGSPGRFVIPATGTTRDEPRPIAIPVTVFQARVKSKPATYGESARYERHPEGDLYTVFYSAAESENLLRLVFAPHRIPIEVVALQRQSGFSVQRADFDQYEAIPRLLEELKPQIGQVQAYLVDHDRSIPNYKLSPRSLKQPAWGNGGTKMWVPLIRDDCTPRTAMLRTDLPNPFIRPLKPGRKPGPMPKPKSGFGFFGIGGG